MKTLTLFIICIFTLMFYTIYRAYEVRFYLILSFYGVGAAALNCLIINGIVETNHTPSFVLLAIAFIAIFPTIFCIVDKSIKRSLLSFIDPWIIFITVIGIWNKYPITAGVDNIVICCLFCAYVSTLFVMLARCYHNKPFSVYNIFARGFTTLIMLLATKYFVLNGSIPDVLFILQFLLTYFDLNYNFHLNQGLSFSPMRGPKSSTTHGADLDNPVEEDVGITNLGQTVTPQEWVCMVDKFKAAADRAHNTNREDLGYRPSVTLAHVFREMNPDARELYMIREYLIVMERRNPASLSNRLFFGPNQPDNYFDEMKRIAPGRFAR